MEFIQENYVWFIVGGIVILMTIIGYFAEKTNYAFKKKEKKEELDDLSKQENIKQNNDQEKIDSNNDQNIIPDNLDTPIIKDNLDNNVQPENVSVSEIKDNLNSDVQTSNMDNSMAGVNAVETSNISEDLYAPLSDNSVSTNDATESQNSVQNADVMPNKNVINGIPEDLYAPINNNIAEEPEQINLENVEPFNMNEKVENNTNQIIDSNNEYSRLFPGDPIIIGENIENKPSEEVKQEDIWNM